MKFDFSVIRILILACACACSGIGCIAFHRHIVWQAIPITVERGKPVVVKIRVSKDAHEVAIRCAPSVWHDLTNSAEAITVQLVSSTRRGTAISHVYPGKLTPRPNYKGGGLGPWGMAALVSDAQYLFEIGGEHRATATVEIDFPSGPPDPASAEIIVMRNPSELGF